MAYLQEGYYSDRTVATAMPSERVTFIQRTYGHLAGAILAFAGIEALLIKSGMAEQIIQQLFRGPARRTACRGSWPSGPSIGPGSRRR